MVGEVKDVATALRMLPPAPCIVVANSAEHVASVAARSPPSYPAPIVHDLQALRRWGGCDGVNGSDACIAAVQLLLLGECSAMIGSLNRYYPKYSLTMKHIAAMLHSKASTHTRRKLHFASHAFPMMHQHGRESRVQPHGSKR